MEIHIPVPNDADSPKFKTTVGSVKWVPENSEIVWSIKSFPVSVKFLNLTTQECNNYLTLIFFHVYTLPEVNSVSLRQAAVDSSSFSMHERLELVNRCCLCLFHLDIFFRT